MTAQEAAELELRSVPSAIRQVPGSAALIGFLRTPLAWVLIAVILGGAAVEGHYRDGNRKACATFAMLIDRQIWRDPINGRGPVVRFCADLATADTVGDM